LATSWGERKGRVLLITTYVASAIPWSRNDTLDSKAPGKNPPDVEGVSGIDTIGGKAVTASGG